MANMHHVRPTQGADAPTTPGVEAINNSWKRVPDLGSNGVSLLAKGQE